MIHISYKKIIVLALVVGSLVSFSSGTTVSASTFNAGRIIDDGVFTDKSTMNPSQIQDFLNAKVPRCDTWGEQPYAGTTRAQYAASRGVSTPFTCLKDYTQDGKRASQIIYDVAQKYSINPQVLIVLLQKEQGLITDDWPWPIQYRSATGYGCPDTADCSAQYYGFTNQVDWAARMFRAILNDSPDWYTPYELGNNFIQYSPNASCGGSTVNIQNRSTQALYNYTPYQPNQAALDAGWGTAPCGAYGNRNFHLYFTGWFGSTFAQFSSLDSPRWMELATNTTKVDSYSGRAVDGTLAQGTHIKFISKILRSDGWCLRTENDHKYNYPKCIPLRDINELEITYEDLTVSERFISTLTETTKTSLRTGSPSGQAFRPNTQIEVDAKTRVGSNWFYVSKFDRENGIERGFKTDKISPSSEYIAITPTWFITTRSTNKIIPSQNKVIDPLLPQGMHRLYTSRTFVNGAWYYRSENDTAYHYDKAIPQSDIQKIVFEPFQAPRWMQMREDRRKQNPSTQEYLDNIVSSGTQIKFTSKLEVNGIWFYRTENDSVNDLHKGFSANSIEDVPYVEFDRPRELRLNKETRKIVPNTGAQIGESLPVGMVREFTSKIIIDGKWYYRTDNDTKYNLNTSILATDLDG